MNQEFIDLVKAIDHIKKNATAKFVETIDIVTEISIDPKKDNIRGVVMMPNGIPKHKKICVFTDENTPLNGADIVNEKIFDKIQSGENFDYEICITDPKFFPKLKSVAKFLSKKGLMPSAKNQTVTNTPQELIDLIQSGKKVNIKNDSAGYVHLPVGKISMSNDMIIENIKTAIQYIRTFNKEEKNKNYIKSIRISTTMGPGSQELTLKSVLNSSK